MEECCPNRPREQVQGGWRSVVPTGPENRCREGGGVLSQQAQRTGAGRMEECCPNRPKEQVLGGWSGVPEALRAGAGRVEEYCPNRP